MLGESRCHLMEGGDMDFIHGLSRSGGQKKEDG